LTTSTTKKVLIDRFDRSQVRGFASPHSMAGAEGVELLSHDGQAVLIPYEQIKVVSFVRDWDGKSVLRERREFLARPKTSGIWVEFVFRDDDRLEGVLPANLQLIEARGYAATPPESAGNAQRLFIPRQALSEVNVMGVVGAKRQKAPKRETLQITLFPVE
jgi:hypothetical protein